MRNIITSHGTTHREDRPLLPQHTTARHAAHVLGLAALLTFSAGVGLAQPPNDAVVESFSSVDAVLPEPAIGASLTAAAVLPSATEAGRTPGALSVSTSGAAAYSIPVWTPPGVGNVDLKLSLEYNARGGNGVLGQGWSLGGLSVIEACPRTMAQDGAPGPLAGDSSGRLCLDGQQLKLVSGNYGTVGAVYATEIESFARIAQISTGLVPAFVVTTKNGLVYEYGTTADSQIYPQSGARRAWALARIRDRQAPVPNQITITYQNDAQYDAFNSGSNIGSYRVLRITYPTTSSGQGPFYQVDFSYSPRPTADSALGFVAGSSIKEPNQLDRITIQPYGTTSIIKSYNLAYGISPTTGRLRLASVTECSASRCLAPTSLAYLPGSGAFLAMAKANVNASSLASPIPIDLNGDGLQDLLFPKASAWSTSRWWAIFANSAGFSAAIDTGINTANSSKILSGAFSGRGVNQILMAQAGYWNLVTVGNTGTSSVSTGVPVNGEFSAVDWDGDGLPDLASIVGTELRIRRNVTAPPGAVAFDTTTFTAATSIGGYLDVNTGSMTSQADFNGDGRGDIAATYFDGNLGYTTATLLSNGFASAPVAGGPGSTVDATRLADVNADGCTDMISLTTTLVSACDGTFRTIVHPAIQTNPGSQVIADVDGDGKSDLLYINTPNKTWYAIRSRGDSYAAPVSLGIVAPNGTSWFVFDQNGDGLADLGFRDDTNGGALKYHLHDGAAAPVDAISTATDGFGILQRIAYATITRSNYTKHTDAVFPEIDVQVPLYVVSEVTADVGSGSDYRLLYSYYGARMHLQGRGFEGFGAVRTSDSRTGFHRIDTIQRAFPYTGMVTQSALLQSDQATRVFEATLTPSAQVLGTATYQRRYFPFIQSATEAQYEYGGTLNGTMVTRAVSTFTYGDGYGNLTASTRTYTDKDPGSPYLSTSWQESTSGTYFNNTTTNCLGLPASSSMTRTAPGKAPMTRTQAYQADTATCRMTQHVQEPNAPELKVASTFGYDVCGNPNQIVVTGASWDGTTLPSRTTRIDYGVRCQFPESVTNPLGEVTTAAYRYDFGVPTSGKDANGATTTWAYDTFGRRTGEMRPDQTTTTWSFDSCATLACMGSPYLRFHVRRVSAGAQGVVTGQQDLYYDGAERLQSSTHVRPLGISTTTRYVYDRQGRKLTESIPASGTVNNGYRAWSYDPLGRVLTEKLYNSSNVLDRTTTYAYAGRTVSVTDPLGRTHSIVRDLTGVTRQAVDPAPGGTTQLDYDSFGNLVRIQDAGGAVSSGSNNTRGFRTDWTDADTGPWSYKRNSFGELVRWSDAKGQLFTASFDALGRMTSRVEPEGQSLWTWGSSAAQHNVGSLVRVAGLGYAEDYAYDGLGRLAKRTITTDQPYAYDYSYGYDGAVDTLTYPATPVPTGQTGSRLKLQYSYSYGGLVTIRDVTEPVQRTLWALSAANDFGSATGESLAGGAATVATGYRPWTNELTSRQAGKSPSTTNRQNLAFDYDLAGNLAQRRDLNQSLTEAFAFDSLNRITGSTLNGVANLSVAYDANGNIASKSDVGSYSYADAAHPHAVTAAGTRSYTYDANGNQKTRDGAAQIWSSFNLPTTVAQTINGATWQAQFSYGPTHERWKQTATYANGTETTQYLGGLLEKESTTSTGKTYWRHYIATPSGRIVVSRNSDATTSTHFAVGDHLGSSSTVLNNAGDVHAKLSFAPFGARRGSDWVATTAPDWLGVANSSRRGFTGHEHVDNVNLIHMGGRVYDPVIGRFLSADPVIGSLDESQSVNPYAYVGNHPLTMTDPSGNEAVSPWAVMGSSSLENTFVSIVVYYTLFKGGNVYTPPAGTIRGVSVQNGTGTCSSGSASSYCAGRLLSSTGSPANSGPPTSTWAVDARAEAETLANENLERLFEDLARNAVQEIVLAPVNDARAARDAYDNGSYGMAAIYVAFTLCDVNCKAFSAALKPLSKAATRARVIENVRKSAASRGTSNVDVLFAKEAQLGGPYGGVDSWTMTTLPEGTSVFGGLPGQSAFYTDAATVFRGGGSGSKVFRSLQVRPDPVLGYRPSMGEYLLRRDIRVPTAPTLANPQFGEGGAMQYFIRNYSTELDLLHTLPLGK